MLDSTLLTSGYFGMHPPKPPGTRCEGSQKDEEKVIFFDSNPGSWWHLLGVCVCVCGIETEWVDEG